MAGILKVDRVQSDSNLAFQVGSSNVAYFNTTGINLSGGEIIAGGSTLRTASGMLYANNGIAFPATQVSSSDANTLDDYEEGTWSPVLNYNLSLSATGSNATTTLTNRGFYTKIGNTVTFSVYVTYSDVGANFTLCYISGLPFVSRNATNERYAVNVATYYLYGQYAGTTITNPVNYCAISENSTQFNTGPANASTGGGFWVFQSISNCVFTGTYRTA